MTRRAIAGPPACFTETVLRILACCGCPLAEERFFPTVHDTVVSIRARAADAEVQSTSGGTS